MAGETLGTKTAESLLFAVNNNEDKKNCWLQGSEKGTNWNVMKIRKMVIQQTTLAKRQNIFFTVTNSDNAAQTPGTVEGTIKKDM